MICTIIGKLFWGGGKAGMLGEKLLLSRTLYEMFICMSGMMECLMYYTKLEYCLIQQHPLACTYHRTTHHPHKIKVQLGITFVHKL